MRKVETGYRECVPRAYNKILDLSFGNDMEWRIKMRESTTDGGGMGMGGGLLATRHGTRADTFCELNESDKHRVLV